MSSSVFTQLSQDQRRRFPRYPLQVPLYVMVLRSGVPSTIPGRSLDLGEGGVAALLAGELRVGESVAVELKLPLTTGSVQAKALVRHRGPLRCGLQFVDMLPEQYGPLRTWTAIAASSCQSQRAASSPEMTPDRQEPRRMAQQGSAPIRRAVVRRMPPTRWPLLLALLALFVAGLVWWSGSNSWQSHKRNLQGPGSEPRITVPSASVERNLLYRVEPLYPPEALASRVEGVVLLDAIIGQDGRVQQLVPISGPEMLVRPAIEAVKQWRFQPYQVEGRPRELETTLEVNFRLHP